MDFDFSLILVIAVAVTGIVWLFDAVLLRPGRNRSINAYMQQAGMTQADYKAYEYALDENKGQPVADVNEQHFQRINMLSREPVLVEYAKSFFPVIFAVLVIRSFLFEPFQIPTGSMIPTLNVGDFIVVNKYSYGIRLPVTGTKLIDIGEPQRGDVMVFIPPHVSTYYIKRVIGLPGDHIRYEDKVLYINGEPVDQQFVAMLQEGRSQVIYSREQLGSVEHDIYKAPVDFTYIGPDYWLPPEGRLIPEGHYFMMGDNRDNSEDSRVWGPVPEANIVGKALAVWMHKEPGTLIPTFSDNRFINN